MEFEVGKYYGHPSGEQLAIIGDAETTMYGRCLVAESNKRSDLKPVGIGQSFAENWFEINKEDWMKNFS